MNFGQIFSWCSRNSTKMGKTILLNGVLHLSDLITSMTLFLALSFIPEREWAIYKHFSVMVLNFNP